MTLRTAMRILLGAALVLALALAAQMARVALYPAAYDGQTADCAIVLGAAVWHRVPSPIFAERIHFGIELAQTGKVRMLVFTGGVGTHGAVSEARVGADQALAAGIPAARILLEEQSHKTLESLENVRPLLAAHGLKRCYLVSDAPHLLRAVTLARSLGLDVRPAATPTSRVRAWQARAAFLLSEAWFLTGLELHL